MDTTVDENTPLVAANSLPCPSTPTRGKKNALPSVNSSQFSTPRHRKTARLTSCQTEVSTPGMTLKQWPRIGKRIPSEDIKAAIQQIFGYEPRSWQLSLAEKVLEGNDAIGLAGTGAGKSLVFAILAVAAQLAEFRGLVLVVSPLKSLENDQVSEFK
jgi:superfamily II DNA helicase RecQ